MSMELPILEIKNAQSRLDVAMNRIGEIISEVHDLRTNDANLAHVRTKLEFLQNDLIKRQKLVTAIVKQIKQVNKFRGTNRKEMSAAYEKLKAFETEVTVLTKIQNEVAMIGNNDFAEFRRLMNPSAALRDLFTGIAILFEVPKWKRWPNVQSFIAKSSTKAKILSLRPEHLNAKTVKRVRKFLNRHEETVNRLAAYKANRKIAPLEPWLRTMVALAEKIVIYGLAPDTMQEELQKMQLKIKSVNNLTQTLAKAKAREKEIVNTFLTIFKAKGESFENFRSLSDFLGEQEDEKDDDAFNFNLNDGSKWLEAENGLSPESDFPKVKDQGSISLGLDFSVGLNTNIVESKSGLSAIPEKNSKPRADLPELIVLLEGKRKSNVSNKPSQVSSHLKTNLDSKNNHLSNRLDINLSTSGPQGMDLLELKGNAGNPVSQSTLSISSLKIISFIPTTQDNSKYEENKNAGNLNLSLDHSEPEKESLNNAHPQNDKFRPSLDHSEPEKGSLNIDLNQNDKPNYDKETNISHFQDMQLSLAPTSNLNVLDNSKLGLRGHRMNMDITEDGKESGHHDQSPTPLSLSTTTGRKNKVSETFSLGLNKPEKELSLSSHIAGNTTPAASSPSYNKILVPGTPEESDSRSAYELDVSIVQQTLNTEKELKKSNGGFPKNHDVEKLTLDSPSQQFTRDRESVIVAQPLNVDEDNAEEMEELDPNLLEALALKMRRSLRDLNMKGLVTEEEEEKGEISTNVFKDIILRWNTFQRNPLDYDTDVFEIWKGMGYHFKTFKKVEVSEKKDKEIGYHVEEDSPWLDTVEEMRTKRAASIKTVGNKKILRQRSKTTH